MSSHAERLKDALAAMPGAEPAPLPSAPGVVLYKLKGKMFAIFSLRPFEAVTVKCDPFLVGVLKERYAAVGHRGHLDRRFWIALRLGADLPDDEILKLVAASYDLVRSGLNRRQRAELDALSRAGC